MKTNKTGAALLIDKYFMVPDFEVIANYPAPLEGEWHKKGDIISPSTHEYAQKYIDFPAIFKRLEWWENRNIWDMLNIEHIEVTSRNSKFSVGSKKPVAAYHFIDTDTLEPKIDGFYVDYANERELVLITQCKPIQTSKY